MFILDVWPPRIRRPRALRNSLDVWQYVKDTLDRLLAGSTDFDSRFNVTISLAHG